MYSKRTQQQLTFILLIHCHYLHLGRYSLTQLYMAVIVLKFCLTVVIVALLNDTDEKQYLPDQKEKKGPSKFKRSSEIYTLSLCVLTGHGLPFGQKPITAHIITVFPLQG